MRNRNAALEGYYVAVSGRDSFSYRPVSKLAITAVVFGFLALPALVSLPFCAFAAAAFLCAVVAGRGIRKYEQSGTAAAVMGFWLGGATLVLSPLWHLSQFNSESLPHHERVDFAAVAASGGFERYINRPICLKGYAYPMGTMREFLSLLTA